MNAPRSRREFLSEVGKGMLVTTLGVELAGGLGLGSAYADEAETNLNFGDIEPLVGYMQDTPPEKLMAGLVGKLQSGTELRKLVAAGALANARTFGGEDYIGFHTIMALMPAWAMSQELPDAQRALPVLKVLHRNTSRIQAHGGRKSEVLRALQAAAVSGSDRKALPDAVHGSDVSKAEQALAALAASSPDEAFNELLHIVQESIDVHRVVLPYRAWDLLGIVGRENALTMLRQSVRFCVRNEKYSHGEPRTLIPKLLDENHLLDKPLGTRQADDAWMDKFVQMLFTSTAAQAATATAAALAEGFAPAAIGEALSLTANQLVLRDQGRLPSQESKGKPPGSTHGDSIGVHASDSANAWRNLARVSNTRNTYACLIVGAYQVAADRTNRGGDFQNWKPLPNSPYHTSSASDPAVLLGELEEAIRGNLQAHAAGAVARYGSLNLPERPVFDLLLKYAISEDGALHAEKYYRTVSDDFATTRASLRWRHLTGLARVTASEYGRPAAGVAEARALLKV